MTMFRVLVLAVCCLGTVHGTSQPYVPPANHPFYTNLLLDIDCRSDLSTSGNIPQPGRGPQGPGYSPGNLPNCQVWVDASGSCRVDWTHLIMEQHCRDVLGNGRYGRLNRHHPSYPPPVGQSGDAPCTPRSLVEHA